MSDKPLSQEVAEKIAALEARVAVDDEAMHHLRELYAKIWPEAFYDPGSAAVEKYAQDLWPHIDALNKKLRFKT